MANPERGEADLISGGEVYTLKWGNGTQRELFSLLDRPPAEVWEMVQQGRTDIITTFVWAMLRKHHPGLSLEDVDDIMDGSTAEDVVKAIALAIQRAQPVGADGNPPKASPSQTGKAS